MVRIKRTWFDRLPAVGWNSSEKLAAARYAAAVVDARTLTPRNDPEARQQVAGAILRMSAIYLSPNASSAEREALGEAFADALDDVPAWAVIEAMRRWHRNECGDKADSRFLPKPGQFRSIAVNIASTANYRADIIMKLLDREQT